MRHISACVPCLSPMDYADSFCAWLVDSFFYWDQSLHRRGLGPVLAARLRTRSQRCERRGTPEVAGRRLSSSLSSAPQRASPQRRAVHFALALLDRDPTFFGPNGKYGGQTCVSLRPVWFARTGVCSQDQEHVHWQI